MSQGIFYHRDERRGGKGGRGGKRGRGAFFISFEYSYVT
jgi:hypothetical protein